MHHYSQFCITPARNVIPTNKALPLNKTIWFFYTILLLFAAGSDLNNLVAIQDDLGVKFQPGTSETTECEVRISKSDGFSESWACQRYKMAHVIVGRHHWRRETIDFVNLYLWWDGH